MKKFKKFNCEKQVVSDILRTIKTLKDIFEIVTNYEDAIVTQEIDPELSELINGYGFYINLMRDTYRDSIMDYLGDKDFNYLNYNQLDKNETKILWLLVNKEDWDQLLVIDNDMLATDIININKTYDILA